MLIAILLVEDNAADALLTRQALTERLAGQFELVHVTRLEAALDAIASARFDLALLDLSLPDTTGLGTFTQIRAAHPDLPIIVLSGNTDEALALKAVVEGACDYVPKDAASGELLARAVRYALALRSADAQVVRLRTHDALTGLPNRAALLRHLDTAMAGAHHGSPAGLLVLDLNRFGLVNQSLGFAAGDSVLREVAVRLRRVAPPEFVARIGDDEFAVVVPEASRPGMAALAQAAIDALAEPFVLGVQSTVITAGIGMAAYPGDVEDAGVLVRHAEMAMDTAKARGASAYRFYVGSMAAQTAGRLEIEEELTRALVQDDLRLSYQPQLDLRTGKVVGVEALLRWQHQQHGIVMPATFLPVAESSGLIVPVGRWVLATACAQQRAWRAAGLPRWQMAVNLSARQLIDDDLVAFVEQTLRQNHLAADQLELELTEDFLLDEAADTRTVLEQLRRMGVRICLDDFGTGHAPLSYLKRLPLDTVKVDRSFVRSMVGSPEDTAIVSATIALAHTLGLRVIAEGVETVAQRELLRSLECDGVQGFLYSRAVSPEHLVSWVHGARRAA